MTGRFGVEESTQRVIYDWTRAADLNPALGWTSMLYRINRQAWPDVIAQACEGHPLQTSSSTPQHPFWGQLWIIISLLSPWENETHCANVTNAYDLFILARKRAINRAQPPSSWRNHGSQQKTCNAPPLPNFLTPLYLILFAHISLNFHSNTLSLLIVSHITAYPPGNLRELL